MLALFRSVLGLGVLGLAVSAPALAAEPRLTLDFRDAPIRSALELLLTLGNKQYQIGSGTVGLVTMAASGKTFAQAMDALSQAASTPLTWTAGDNGVISIGPSGPSSAMPEFPQNPPGFARTAAVGTFGNVRKAVLEFGAPPNSTTEVVGVGVLVRDSTTGTEWRVASIGPKGCELRAGSEKRILPLAGLTPPRR